MNVMGKMPGSIIFFKCVFLEHPRTEKARQASSVCMQRTTSIGSSEEHRARSGAWACTSSVRYVGVTVADDTKVKREAGQILHTA